MCKALGASCDGNSDCCELNCDATTGTCKSGSCPIAGQACSPELIERGGG